ncbi:MAG: hypothetical protein AAGA23_06440 [Pseudomonadota bacterium]
MQFGNVVIEFLETDSQPKPNNNREVKGHLVVAGEVVRLSEDLSLHAWADDAPGKYSGLSIFEQLNLQTGQHFWVFAYSSVLLGRQLVVVDAKANVKRERIPPGEDTPLARRFLAATSGMNELLEEREACLDHFASIDNLWDRSTRELTRPCINDVRDQIHDLLGKRGISRAFWMEAGGLNWAIEELEKFDDSRALATAYMIQHTGVVSTAGADAADYFAVALAYPSDDVVNRSLLALKTWASLYGHRTSDMVPRVPPPPDLTQHRKSWEDEVERAIDRMAPLLSLVEAHMVSPNPDVVLSAAMALNEGWPAGTADAWETELLMLASDHPRHSYFTWLTAADLIIRDGIASRAAEDELWIVALTDENARSSYHALTALLSLRPSATDASKLFSRLVELMNEPDFRGDSNVFWHLERYPEISDRFRGDILRLKKASENQPGWWPRENAEKLERVLQSIDESPEGVDSR